MTLIRGQYPGPGAPDPVQNAPADALQIVEEIERRMRGYREALEDTNVVLARVALRLRTYAPGLGLLTLADDRIQENQRVLELATPEAEKR